MACVDSQSVGCQGVDVGLSQDGSLFVFVADRNVVVGAVVIIAYEMVRFVGIVVVACFGVVVVGRSLGVAAVAVESDGEFASFGYVVIGECLGTDGVDMVPLLGVVAGLAVVDYGDRVFIGASLGLFDLAFIAWPPAGL